MAQQGADRRFLVTDRFRDSARAAWGRSRRVPTPAGASGSRCKAAGNTDAADQRDQPIADKPGFHTIAGILDNSEKRLQPLIYSFSIYLPRFNGKNKVDKKKKHAC